MEIEAFVLAWSIVWLAAVLLPAYVPSPLRRLAWTFPAAGILLLVVFRDLAPAFRLLASSLLFLYLMKAAVLAKVSDTRLSWAERLMYMTAWPGMDPEHLADRGAPRADTSHRFGRGLTITLFGVALAGATALWFPLIPAPDVGWLGIVAVLTAVHFGFSDILTSLLWLSGRPVRPLFDHPLRSRRLSEFWSSRWNIPYVEMNRRFFLPAIQRYLPARLAIFAVFLVSGLLHEMAISYPAGAGWGGPLLYFAIQGTGTLLERRLKIRSRVWTWLWVLVPVPLLFHEAFRTTLIVPLFGWLHGLLVSRALSWYVEMLLWVLPVMQLSVLMASYQVPKRLNWHEDLAQLTPFNRKLMWTYAIFIVTTVISFAIMTFALHRSFMAGETAAVALACFMSGFWVLRLTFDTFYYKSEDWPAGEIFQIGHALLNALFVFLALGYGAIAVWGQFLTGR